MPTTKRKQSKQKEKKMLHYLFNPPYSVSVKTNIGRAFIKLISKHSLPNHKFVETLTKKQSLVILACQASDQK